LLGQGLIEQGLIERGLIERGLIELGQGLDNTAFRYGDLVVRVARGEAGRAGGVRRESELLAAVGPRVSLAVPAPIFADEELGVMAYPLLPGRPLLGRTPPAEAAGRLGRFLAELHSIDLALVSSLVDEDSADPRDWLADLSEQFDGFRFDEFQFDQNSVAGVLGRADVSGRGEVADVEALIDRFGRADLLDVLAASVPPPGTHRVLAHADLGAEHLLADNADLTGVLDWSDAAVTDPALDFARLLRDFGPEFLRSTLATHDILTIGEAEPDSARSARIEFFARCAALEDLIYAKETGRPDYARAALASLEWLFPAQ
jgi:aminoglycoside phosphotransferase (APT) family kinase protein